MLQLRDTYALWGIVINYVTALRKIYIVFKFFFFFHSKKHNIIFYLAFFTRYNLRINMAPFDTHFKTFALKTFSRFLEREFRKKIQN